MTGAKTTWVGGVHRIGMGCALFLTPAVTFAQAVPAGQPGAPTREQIEQPSVAAEKPKPQISVRSDNAFAEEPCSLTSSDIHVKLTEIRFEAPGGGGVNSSLGSFLTGLQPDEGGDQPISVVCRIRDRINGALAQAGYVARVQIPPQELQDGTLRLIVVAGHVVEMRVRGNVGRFNSLLSERLAKITALNPFNKDEAVHILLLANDIPGLKVQMALRNAGGAPGDLIGDVSVEAQTAQVLFNVQNFGSRQLGREIATLRGEIYGLTGFADRTYLSYSNSLQWNETHIGQVGHDMALNDNGLRLGVRLNLAQSEPSIPNLHLQSRSLIAGMELSTQLLKSVNGSISTTAGLEVLNQATRILSGSTDVPFTHDQTRELFARVNGSYIRRAQNGSPVFHIDGYAEIRKGLDIFSASETGKVAGGFAPSRFEGDPMATVIRGEIDTGVALVPGLLSIDAQLFGQWANHALLNLDEFSIGNFTFGRGYDPGANGGDRAIAGRIEPRVTLGTIGPVRLEATGFADVVGIWNLDKSAGLEAKRSFLSVGGGLRAILPGRGVLDITYAKPLDKALTFDKARPTERVLVSLTTKLWPWGVR